MEDELILSEENKERLLGIISQMESNGEEEKDIQFIVDEFKQKYGKKKISDTESTTSDSEDGVSASLNFDYQSRNFINESGEVVDISQVPDSIKEKTFINPIYDEYTFDGSNIGEVEINKYPRAFGLDGTSVRPIPFGDEGQEVFVDSEGVGLYNDYKTIKEEYDSLNFRYSQATSTRGIPKETLDKLEEEKNLKLQELETITSELQQNSGQNTLIQNAYSYDIISTEPDFKKKIIYNTPSEGLFGEPANDIVLFGATTQEKFDYTNDLLFELSEENHGLFTKIIESTPAQELNESDLRSSMSKAFDKELQDRAYEFLSDEEINLSKLRKRQFELQKEIADNPNAENIADLRNELSDLKLTITRGYGESAKITPMFDFDGNRIDREFVSSSDEKTINFNQEIEANYSLFDGTERGQLLTIFEKYSAADKQLKDDYLNFKFKTKSGEISLKDATIALIKSTNPYDPVDASGLVNMFFKSESDDIVEPLRINDEEKEYIKSVVENYQNLYSSNKAKLIAATRVLFTNTDPGSMNKGGFLNLKLFGEGFAEGLGFNVDSDADFISMFGQVMKENGIELTESQLEQVRNDVSDMVAMGLGNSIPIMAQIMLTRNVPVAFLKSLKSSPRVMALANYLSSQGTPGKFALNLAKGTFTGAVSFGLAPSDKVSWQMGTAEGFVEAFFPVTARYARLVKLMKAAKIGDKAMPIGLYSVRSVLGGQVELVAEYSGEMLDSLTKKGLNWEKALEETFGKTDDEKLDKLLATAITCTMFSSAFSAGMLKLTVDEINTIYGGSDSQRVQEALAKLDELIEKYKRTESGTQLSLLDNEAFVEGTTLLDEESVRQRGGEATSVPEGSKLFNDPVSDASAIADEYLQQNSEELGITPTSASPIPDIDIENSKRIADAFDAMKHDPNNPEVKAAYAAMAQETIDQYNLISDRGYKVEIWKGEGEPYANSAEMLRDVRDNKHMYIFSTESGFGQEGITQEQRAENPLLAETEFTDINGEPLLVNDLFRFVHDFFGHAELGNGFGPKGEENAWVNHSRMYSPQARRAMTTETRGQNSWVNFGKQIRREDGSIPVKGDPDYVPLSERQYADQKIGLLPDDIVNQLPGLQTVITEVTDVEPTVEFTEEANTFASEQIENALENKVDQKTKNRLGRLDLGMSTVKIQKGISDYKNGIESEERADLENALKTMYDSGEIKFLGTDGKKVVRNTVNTSELNNIKPDVKVTKDQPYVFNRPELNKEQFDLNMQRTQNGTVEGGTTFNEEMGNLDGKKLFSVSIFPDLSVKKPAGQTFTQEEIEAFKIKHRNLLDRNKNLAVGTFTSGDSGISYLDIVALVSDAAKAEQMAIDYNQESFYDLYRGKVRQTGGTGETIEGMPTIEQRISDIEEANIDESFYSKLDKQMTEFLERDMGLLSDPFLLTPTVKVGVSIVQQAMRGTVYTKKSLDKAVQQAIDYIKANKPNSEEFNEQMFRDFFNKKGFSPINVDIPNRNPEGIVEVNENELEEDAPSTPPIDVEGPLYQEEREGDASVIDKVEAKRENDFNQSKKLTAKEFRIKVQELIFDENYRFKYELEKLGEEYGLSAQALEAVAFRNLVNGASASAKSKAQKILREMDGGIGKSHLNKKQRKLSDSIIEYERIIALDNFYDSVKSQADNLINELSSIDAEKNPDIYESYLKKINSLAEKMGLTFDTENGNLMKEDVIVPAGLGSVDIDGKKTLPWRILNTSVDLKGKPVIMNSADAKAWMDREMANNPDWQRARERADIYFEATNNLLKFKYEKGLITKETYDRLKDIKYSPRVFIDKILYTDDKGEVIADKFETKKDVQSLSGILASLESGSTKALYNNASDLIQKQILAAEKIAFLNDSRKSVLDFLNEAEKNGQDVSDFGYVISKSNPKKDGYTVMDVLIDGEVTEMAIDNEIAGSFSSKTTSANWGRILSGTSLLKTWATGTNPLFALTNFPRDFQHVLLSTDTYSSILPIGAAQFSSDLSSVMMTSMTRGKEYQKALSQGLGMDYLSTSGKIEINKGDSKVAKGAKDVSNAMSWFGETSEILVRMAVRSRQITKRTAEFEAQYKRKPNLKELDKIERLATEDARRTLDFSQGGTFTKQLDAASPYLNASLQGFRVGAKYMKDNPIKSAFKIGQLGVMTMSLAAYNIAKYKDDYDKLSKYEKINNFIFMLPWKDEKGNRQYLRVKKDHFMMPFTTIFEDYAYLNETGINPNSSADFGLFIDEEDKSNLQKAFELSNPITGIVDLGNVFTGIPTFSALIAYNANYDTFRDDEIYKSYRDVKSSSEVNYNTQQLFIDIGQATNMSPARLQTSFGKLFTDPNRNIWINGFSTVYEEITSGMREEDIVELNNYFNKGFLNNISEPARGTILRSVPEVAKDESIIEVEKNKKLEDTKNESWRSIKNELGKEYYDIIKSGDSDKIRDFINTAFDRAKNSLIYYVGPEVRFYDTDENIKAKLGKKLDDYVEQRDLNESLKSEGLDFEGINIGYALIKTSQMKDSNPETAAIYYINFYNKMEKDYGIDAAKKIDEFAEKYGIIKKGNNLFNIALTTLEDERIKARKEELNSK